MCPLPVCVCEMFTILHGCYKIIIQSCHLCLMMIQAELFSYKWGVRTTAAHKASHQTCHHVVGHQVASCRQQKCCGSVVKCKDPLQSVSQSVQKKPAHTSCCSATSVQQRGRSPESTLCVPARLCWQSAFSDWVKRFSATLTGVSRCIGRGAAAWFAVWAAGGGTKGREAPARPSGPTRTPILGRRRGRLNSWLNF